MRAFVQKAIQVVILSALAAGSFGMVFAWTGPTAAPPSNNVSAPLNVTSTAQTKAGAITATNFCLSSPSVCLGTVLTGGVYMTLSNGQCWIGNTVTGGTCTCPAYAPYARNLSTAYYNSSYYEYTYFCLTV